MPAGTKLRHTVIDTSMAYEDRQKVLRQSGIVCECSLGRAQKNTSNEKKAMRTIIKKAVTDRILTGKVTPIEKYNEMLAQTEATHTHPASEEPRLEMQFFLYLYKTTFV